MNKESEASGKNVAVDRVVNCFNCKHWRGDKVKQAKSLLESGAVCMDVQHGWPEEGTCEIMSYWADVEVNGDAWAEVKINSNFMCNRHERDS